MTFWIFIIFVMGLLLTFAHGYLVENNLVGYVGIIVTLICIGLGVRTQALRRKGVKERLARQVKDLEEKQKAGPDSEKT